MKRFWIKTCLSLFLVFVLCLLVVEFVVNPAAYNACETKIRAVMFQEINTAALESMKGGVGYDDLFRIERDAEGKILMIGANTPKINEIAKGAAEAARGRTEVRAQQGVTVSLGTFSGISFLGGAGSDINFDVQPAGYVDVSFRSEFTSVGINQTRHRIVADFSSVFTLILPLSERKIEVTSEMLICENVIVGEVPDFYFDNNGGNLDLIPSKGLQ